MAMAEKTEQKTNVLVVTFSSQGHINPLLRLGKCLQSKGLHVTLATTELARHRMFKHSSSTTTDTTATAMTISGISLQFFSDGLSLDYDRKTNLNNYMDCLSKFGPINLSNLIKDLYQRGFPKFSCIIATPFVPWAADVAAEHQTPCALIWIQPCALFSIYYHFVNKLSNLPTSEDPEITVKLPGIPLLNTVDLPSFLLPSNRLDSILILVYETLENIKKFKWVLANSFYELEKDVIDGISNLVSIKSVGPLIPTKLLGENEIPEIGIDMWKAEDKCLDWLNQKSESSVIYAAFGSIAVLSRTQMENVANALKNTNMDFIWVVKPPDYPVHEGEGEVPEGFLDEIKEKGMVVPWCHQTSVLSHPSIACFLTHCGWNSVLEAISAGVPLIGFPQWSDQPTNSKLMADVFGVGLRVWPEKDGVVSSQALVTCIEEVVSGHRAAEFRAKATEWKLAARGAVATGGSSDQNIQWFVNEIVKNSSPSQRSLNSH
ncbi:hypothetical protein Nepgr_004680 [Nepenthes gracilis]|uniref:Glycosyltransferase n=1 Tax=Nepenthes gracilis TaxID=150966 RepID=A0AAD3S2A9_NEPGR|nr:hypothetical protein Nepgr_004680 [Nepenthes gracilis]